MHYTIYLLNILGGNLTLCLSQHIRDTNRQQPAGLLLVSPCM